MTEQDAPNWFPPEPEQQRCWLGWSRLNATHVHRCGGDLEHPGLHVCSACGAVYIRQRVERVSDPLSPSV